MGKAWGVEAGTWVVRQDRGSPRGKTVRPCLFSLCLCWGGKGRPQLAVAEASGLGRERRMKERRREEGKRQEEEWEGERSLEGHCNQGNSGKAGGPTGSLGPPLRSLTSQSKGRDARRAWLLLASHPQGSSTRPGGGRKAGRLQLPWRWGYGEASEGERGEEEIEARWGVGGKWEPMWEEPTDPRCLGPFPDHPGPLGPSKSPPPQPQATTVSNTHPPSLSFPTHPTRLPFPRE